MHPIRNAVIWAVLLLVILITESQIPKTERDWQIVGALAFVGWCFVSALWLLRAMIRFIMAKP